MSPVTEQLQEAEEAEEAEEEVAPQPNHHDLYTNESSCHSGDEASDAQPANEVLGRPWSFRTFLGEQVVLVKYVAQTHSHTRGIQVSSGTDCMHRLTGPICLSFVATMLLQVTMTMFLGRLGTTELAAGALSNTYCNVCLSVCHLSMSHHTIPLTPSRR
jgi:hypothetical protein